MISIVKSSFKMSRRYNVLFSVYCLMCFAKCIEADSWDFFVARSVGKMLYSHFQECKGAENLSLAQIVQILTAPAPKDSEQCMIECMLESLAIVDEKSQGNMKLIQEFVEQVQLATPKPGVDLAQELLKCDYQPKDNVCLAGFKEYACGRKVLETYWGEGLFSWNDPEIFLVEKK